MARLSTINLLRSCFSTKHYWMRITAVRGILSEAYLCDEAWQKRLENPILNGIKMNQYFVETDKKFGTKRLVSGVDLDLFANNIQNVSELEELEHLLYRFRRTKRAAEMMDSTTFAIIKIYLKFQEYESLLRILNDRESYGVFPDLHSYNILMGTFIKEKMYREAANIAILMMLQEHFDNKICCTLGIYSCEMYLKNVSDVSVSEETNVEEEEKPEDDDEEETLVRVPHIRNPWFDDHFNITNPQHLLGKTLYLLGRELGNTLGRSYQIIGLSMYEKWDKAAAILKEFSESQGSEILSETVERTKLLIDAIPDDEEKSKEMRMKNFDELFQKIQSENKVSEGDLMPLLELQLKEALQNQEVDIELQKRLFRQWEEQRKTALDKQNMELDKERRLKVIEEKKEYLYWKEKLLFFFENEDKILQEKEKVDEYLQSEKEKMRKRKVDDTYVPPIVIKKAAEKLSIYKKLARVKKL